MNFLLITEKITDRKLLLNSCHIISISFNDVMKSIVVATTKGTYQAISFVVADKEMIEQQAKDWKKNNQ